MEQEGTPSWPLLYSIFSFYQHTSTKAEGRMEYQSSQPSVILDSITNEGTNSGDSRPPSSSTFSDSNMDILSHDSTHVQLVIEAERQTSLARERAASILMKLSMEVETGGAAKIEDSCSDDDSDKNENDDHETDAIDKGMNEHSVEQRDDGNSLDVVENIESNLDNLRIAAASANPAESSNPSQSENRASTHQGVFEVMETPSSEDIEHLKQCIIPLSPSAVVGGKKSKRISGQFEFKRMNSVLTVVKSFDDQSKFSYNSSGSSKRSMSSKSRSRSFWRKKGSKHSDSSTNSIFNESNALTDDAFMLEIYEEEARNLKKKNRKKKKAGDLPPRTRRRSSSFITGSTGACPSDAGGEDVISVVSNMSELSLESVNAKMVRNTSASLIIVTDESQRQGRIPETICLKSHEKLSKFGKLRRKLSLNRGKASF